MSVNPLRKWYSCPNDYSSQKVSIQSNGWIRISNNLNDYRIEEVRCTINTESNAFEFEYQLTYKELLVCQISYKWHFDFYQRKSIAFSSKFKIAIFRIYVHGFICLWFHFGHEVSFLRRYGMAWPNLSETARTLDGSQFRTFPPT
jgi:hypothetical protein